MAGLTEDGDFLYVKYIVPVYVKVEKTDEGAEVTRVIVYDEGLSDVVAYEDEDGAGVELSEAEVQNCQQALEHGMWPAWEFGW